MYWMNRCDNVATLDQSTCDVYGGQPVYIDTMAGETGQLYKLLLIAIGFQWGNKLQRCQVSPQHCRLSSIQWQDMLALQIAAQNHRISREQQIAWSSSLCTAYSVPWQIHMIIRPMTNDMWRGAKKLQIVADYHTIWMELKIVTLSRLSMTYSLWLVLCLCYMTKSANDLAILTSIEFVWFRGKNWTVIDDLYRSNTATVRVMESAGHLAIVTSIQILS